MRDIPGFEGLYAATEDGKIYSYRTDKYLKSAGSKGDYQMVLLQVNNKRHFDYVHRLVAMAYLDNPDNLAEVNHKDHVRDNNHVDNLEWVTKYDNLRDRHLGIPIRCIETGKVYNSMNQACKELKIKQPNMTAYLRGRLQSVKGLHFEKV